MKINKNHIYILFTSFTQALFNIFVQCKYCKYGENVYNRLFFIVVIPKTVKNHIYMAHFYKRLTYNILIIFIYHIYNIYSFRHTPQPR